MKPKQFLIPFLLISFILVLSASHQLDFESQPKFHVTQMRIEFDELNATATIDYDVGFLTQMYIFLFGSRNLAPYLEDFLYDFKEFQITSISETKATVELTNSSRISGPYYLFDSRQFRSTVPSVIHVYPKDPNSPEETREYKNVNETKGAYYDVK